MTAHLWVGVKTAVLTWWPADVVAIGDLLSGTLALLGPAIGGHQRAGWRLRGGHQTIGAVGVIHGGFPGGAVVGSWRNTTWRFTDKNKMEPRLRQQFSNQRSGTATNGRQLNPTTAIGTAQLCVSHT